MNPFSSKNYLKKSRTTSSQVTILNLNEAFSQTCRVGGGGGGGGFDKASMHTTSTTRSASSSSNNSNSNNNNNNNNNTVSFSKTIQTEKRILRRVDYTPMEKKATWYDSSEYRTQKEERQSVIKLMEEHGGNNENSDLQGCCTRGLEFKTKEGIKHRANVILHAVCAVLDEQDDQGVRCSVDAEVLAKIYRAHTKRSQQQALERAKRDQEEAQNESFTALAMYKSC